eukprot:COSAG04_NODE_1104_length_8239_cov_19.226658_6_plen_252_part_00
MDDPIGGHPTRAEQLDVLVSCIAATARPGDTVLDVGCGTGYLAHLLLEKRPDLRYCGVDLNEASLAEGRGRFAGLGDRVSFVRGDLQRVDNISLPHSALTCRFAVTVLTFHDLSADEKPAVLGWMLRHVADDGYLLLYDRLRLVAPSLFPVQRAVWDRVEAVHGRPMRSADSYDEYEADLGEGNNPGSLVRPPPPPCANRCGRRLTRVRPGGVRSVVWGAGVRVAARAPARQRRADGGSTRARRRENVSYE